MGNKVTFDYSKASCFVSEAEVASMEKLVAAAKEELVSRSGAGNDFLGWIDLPVAYDKEEFARIKKAAEKIKSDSEVLLVIGIGGSYLGARAAIEFLRHSFYNMVPQSVRKTPEIYFVGNSISSTYVTRSDGCDRRTVISPSILFPSPARRPSRRSHSVSSRKCWMKKYGKAEAAKRIYATTDKARGALKNLATEEGYETFVVPDDVGGRFSVLTAVGLLPIAVSGADIDQPDGGRSFRKKHMLWKHRLQKMMRFSMRHCATSCCARERRSRYSQTMSRACIMYPSGGSSFTVRVKERTRRVSSRHRLI